MKTQFHQRPFSRTTNGSTDIVAISKWRGEWSEPNQVRSHKWRVARIVNSAFKSDSPNPLSKRADQLQSLIETNYLALKFSTLKDSGQNSVNIINTFATHSDAHAYHLSLVLQNPVLNNRRSSIISEYAHYKYEITEDPLGEIQLKSAISTTIRMLAHPLSEKMK